MTTPFGAYEPPEGVEVPARQPAYCPYCGSEKAFDGLGSEGHGARHGCPQCGLVFETYLPTRVRY